MRSALALRTSLVTAVIAGTLLAPAASSAFAATTAGARTVATAIETGAQIGRYEGKPVYIGEGLVAVLRNEAEGPEAWIRYVGPDWKPGDTYIVRVMGLLNRTETTTTLSGLQLKLTKAGTASPVLTVTKDGATKSYPLPKGKAVPAASCVSKVKKVAVGMYMTADLTMSPQGPKAFVHATDPKDTSGMVTLTRTSPKGPDDYYLRIANPSGAAPVLEWKTQGGAGVPVEKAAFPALPKGCKAEYPLQNETTAPKPAPTPAKPAASNVAPQTKTQTSVVPKGAVAAGIEVADTDDTTTMAAGAGLLAIFAVLGAGALRRRRS